MNYQLIKQLKDAGFFEKIAAADLSYAILSNGTKIVRGTPFSSELGFLPS